MEMQSDGLPLGSRVWLQAATAPGVTFASGNTLNMDGNGITNLVDPSANQDAATKAYVDKVVGGIPPGDITAVTAGTGLSGGGNTGNVILNADADYVQRRISSTCAAGSSIRAIGTDGSVTCETDDNAGGDITAITAGTGLSGGGSSGAVTLDVSVPLNLSGSVGKNGIIQGTNTAVDGYGVQGTGDGAGGYFVGIEGRSFAWVGVWDKGIEAVGSITGGVFLGDSGIHAYGKTEGGYFEQTTVGNYASLASNGYGIKASGHISGGLFSDLVDSGYARVGAGDTGIKAYGNTSGGYFEEPVSGNSAIVANKDYGIVAYGNFAGGYFEDRDSGNFADVGYSTYKIYGTGTVNFVQNHPENSDEVIVYTAPEGDEVATYTRGSAKLVNGEAHIPLGETFQWVTNPDIGLTAHLTPRGGWAALYVASLSTTELVVKAAADTGGNVEFDYLVYGLRIGFEDTLVVQKKTREARIPSMADHRRQFDEHPEMHQYTALSRYARMQDKDRKTVRQNMPAATALLQAVEEFDPRTHKIPTPDHSKKQLNNDGEKL